MNLNVPCRKSVATLKESGRRRNVRRLVD